MRRALLSSKVNFPGGIPAFASAVGYNRVVFLDHFGDIRTINMTVGDLTPGYNWYQDPDNPANPASYLSVANSILTIDGTNQPRILSVGTGTSGFSYVGTVLPASNGIYFEMRAQFPAVPGGTPDFKPNLYMYDNQFLLDKLNSTPIPQHYAEIDLMEGRPATTNLQQVVHDWSSLAANTQTPASPASYSTVNLALYHTYGYLLIPMAANSGTGILRFYVDRVQSVADITWTAGSLNSCLECPGSGYSFYMAAAAPSYNIDYVAALTP